MSQGSRFSKFFASIACVFAAGLCFGASNVAKADDMAYMSANSGEFGVVFGTIDLNTGVFSSLGLTEVGSSQMPLSGMADLSGTLYGAPEGTNDTSIYTINPANGALTRVGTTGIAGLSFDDFGSTTTGLFVVDSFGQLYSVNATTGAATPIGSGGIPVAGFSALSTNDGTLYYADGNNLYTLNTTTGAATLIGSLGDSTQLTALLQENGTLYGTPDPLSVVATVDPTTGAATIGSDITGAGTGLVTGLAPYPLAVPAPVIGHGLPVVLAVGGLLFGAKLVERSRRRRSFGAALPHAAA